MTETADELRPAAAVKAMRARGIDNAEELLSFADPDRILATCQWWDGLKGVRPGLLAKRVREGGVELEPKAAAGSVEERLRATAAEHAERFPVGSIALPHAADWQARQFTGHGKDRRCNRARDRDGEPCSGSLLVMDHDYPVWTLECDRCGEMVGLTPREMPKVLSGTGRLRDAERLAA